MICAWCRSGEDDGTGSHSICETCKDLMILQSVQRQYNKVPSYAETNAVAFAAESEEESLAYYTNCALCYAECAGH